MGRRAHARGDAARARARTRGRDVVDVIHLAAEIGREALDEQRRLAALEPAHRRGEMRRALIGHVVAIDAGEDDVVEPPLRDGLGDVLRLVLVERGRLAARDERERAARSARGLTRRRAEDRARGRRSTR